MPAPSPPPSLRRPPDAARPAARTPQPRENNGAPRTRGLPVHEINLAARYATHLIAMRDGRIVAEGTPGDVVTEALVEEVFGLACRVIPDPDTGGPVVLPRGRAVAQLERDFHG